MTGVVVVLLFSVLCAAAVVSVLAVGHRPEEGWQRWMRQSLDAWRAEELRSEQWAEDSEDVDLFSLGESSDGTGYTHPDELRARLNRLPARG